MGGFSDPALSGYDGWAELRSWQVKTSTTLSLSGAREVSWDGAILRMDYNGAFIPVVDSVTNGTTYASLRVEKLGDDGRTVTRYELSNLSFTDVIISQSSGHLPLLEAGIIEPVTYTVTHYNGTTAISDMWNFTEGTSESVLFEISPADYDLSGYIDNADYSIWTNEYGRSGFGVHADGNGDGVVSGADFLLWQNHKGSFASAAQVKSVPEPMSFNLVALAAIGLLFFFKRGKSRFDTRFIPATLCTVLAVGASPSSATVVMDIHGIAGDFSLAPFYSDAIEIDGWEMAISRTNADGQPTILTFENPFFSMELDSSYVGLTDALYNGTVLSRVFVDQLDEVGQPYLRHNLQNAQVSNLTLTESPDSTARLVGSFTFDSWLLEVPDLNGSIWTTLMSISVTETAPEPSTIVLLGIVASAAILRRNRSQNSIGRRNMRE